MHHFHFVIPRLWSHLRANQPIALVAPGRSERKIMGHRQRVTLQLKEFEREHLLIRDGRRIIIVPDKLLAISKAATLLHR
jgi:hypothetical protein